MDIRQFLVTYGSLRASGASEAVAFNKAVHSSISHDERAQPEVAHGVTPAGLDVANKRAPPPLIGRSRATGEVDFPSGVER